MSMLEQVFTRAVEDEIFRQALLSDPAAALASAGYALSEDECAVIDEYRRVASTMTDRQLADAIRNYSTARQGGIAAGL